MKETNKIGIYSGSDVIDYFVMVTDGIARLSIVQEPHTLYWHHIDDELLVCLIL